MSVVNTLKAILIFDLTGKRVIAKYYDEDKTRDVKKFERQLFQKTRVNKKQDEVLMIEGSLVLHKLISDHHIYVVGTKDENPLILDKALRCLAESINTLVSRNPDSSSLQGNLDQIILALDEICDQGVLLETDPELVIDRVCLEGRPGDQSLAQVFQSAAEMRFPWIRS